MLGLMTPAEAATLILCGAMGYRSIDLTIERKTRDVVAKSAAIVTTFADAGPGLTPNPAVASVVAQAEAKVAPLVNRVIGEAATDLLRTENPAGESTLGNLIADAQRTALGTDFAFMNPGGIRADVSAGPVTFGELFATLYQNLGIDPNAASLPDLTGRPQYLVEDSAKPLPELV